MTIATHQTKGILQAVPLRPIVYKQRYSQSPDELHIILAYGVDRLNVSHWEGLEFWGKLTEQSWNERIQAFRVKLPRGLRCESNFPHISLSWIRGASPVEAGKIWHRQHETIPIDASVQFRIEFKPFAH